MSTVTPRCWILRSVVLMGLMLAAGSGVARAGIAPAASAGVAERYGKLPLSFEANQGQTDARVKFLARGPGYAVFLTADEAVLTLRPPENPPASINPFFNPLPPGEGRVRGSQQDFFLEEIFAHTGQAPADLQSRVVPPHPNPLPEGEGAKALDRLLRGAAAEDAQGAVLRMRLEGARTAVPVTGRERLPGMVNYLKGRDPAGWRTGIATYGRVEYRGVYPGIDLVYYGHQRSLEYDFIVAPGADPNQIRLSFAGEDPAAAPRLEANGDLLLPTAAGAVRLRKPVVYQEIDGRRRAVEGRFVMLPPTASAVLAASPARVGFQVGDYDPTRPLVIDPVLAYSTYVGGSSFSDYGYDIAVDGAGNAYVTGFTYSSDFPTVNAKYPWRGERDAFVFKLSADGQMARYSTYLGGSSADEGHGIAVDGAGNALVTGETCSSDFPTVNAKYPEYRGGYRDAFVFKLSADGQTVYYSTYLGGYGGDWGWGIAVDGAGNAHVTGWTISNDFPTVNARYPELWGFYDAFLFKLSADGQTVRYSTYLGGSGEDGGHGIAVDGAGNAYVTGSTGSSDFPTVHAKYPELWGSRDVFVFKLSADGQAVRYSTYLGGSGLDYGIGIAVDGAGNAHVTGWTGSNDFPTVNAKYPELRGSGDSGDAFVFKLSADGQTVRYSTYLGGTYYDTGSGIAVDGAGNAYVTGYTQCSDFPVVNAIYPQLRGTDAFVFKLSVDGQTVRYSTYLGGSGTDQGNGIAVDGAGNAYVTGSTDSYDFPTSANDPNIVSYDPTYNGNTDAFIAKLSSSDLILTPTTQDFGIVPPNQTADRTYTLQNLGEKTLTGTVAAPAPYSVTAGASFTLATGSKQDLIVRYAPSRAGIHHRTLTIAGNFPRLTAALFGISGPVAQQPPQIANIPLKGVPGDSLSLTGRYFGPLPGQLAIDGNATPTQTWSDGYLRFTLPTLAPGSHSLTVTTAYGQAQTRLQILGSQPIITALRPGNGAPGSTVILDGYNFGAQQGSATLTVGGQNAPIKSWSDPRISFQIPALKTGGRYPLRLTTPTGGAEKTLLVRDLFLLTEYGDCDPGTWLFAYDICPPIILTVKNPREGGAKLDIQVENLVDRWYELTITPVGATVPGEPPHVIGPKQKVILTNVSVSAGARIQFFADATSNEGMKAVAFDLLYVAARGGHLPADAIDSALEAFNLMTPDSDLVVFFANMVLNITQGDKLALIEQIRDLPSLAKDPAVQLFLSGYLGLSPEHIARFGNLGAVVHIGGVVIKMLEQLALPRYAASALTAQ